MPELGATKIIGGIVFELQDLGEEYPAWVPIRRDEDTQWLTRFMACGHSTKRVDKVDWSKDGF